MKMYSGSRRERGAVVPGHVRPPSFYCWLGLLAAIAILYGLALGSPVEAQASAEHQAFSPPAAAVSLPGRGIGVGPFAGGAQIFGKLGLESRLFPAAPLSFRQPRWHSLAVAAETGYEGVLGQHVAVRAIGFARWDQSDSRRSHADLREAFVQVGTGSFTAEIGMNTVFWGVTESRHLVDVVNQTDYLEDLDGDDKLGQLMARFYYDALSLGLFEVFVMSGSRPQLFPGRDGRPGVPLPVLYDQASYGAGAGRWDPDWAARWSHAVGEIDWAVSLFRGTSREPQLVPIEAGGELALQPFYDLIRQGGVELQWTRSSWSWKAEGMYRDGPGSSFLATTFGFEWTSWGVFRSPVDVGVLLEYGYDGRDDFTFVVQDNDVFAGVRISPNDTSGSEILAGVMTDVETGSTFGSVEASRRMGERMTLELAARFFSVGDGEDPLHWFRRDHYLQTAVTYLF